MQAIVSCGFWDNSIRCYAVDDGRLLQTLRQHKDIVTCIAVAGNGTSLVSGSTPLLPHDHAHIMQQLPLRSRHV